MSSSMHEIRLPYEQRKRVYAPLDYDNSKTEQHHKETCDVNTIVAKYKRTGVWEHAREYAGQYVEMAGEPDFHSAMNKILQAEQMFMSLPARIRDQFQNDPGKYLKFATDPANLDKMREMGLAPKKPEQAPVGVGSKQPQVAGGETTQSPSGDKKAGDKSVAE